MIEWLKGKKTYITAVLGMLATGIAYLNGEVGGAVAIAAIWTALQTAFLRAGITTAVTKATA
jgi:hypothetical protein